MSAGTGWDDPRFERASRAYRKLVFGATAAEDGWTPADLRDVAALLRLFAALPRIPVHLTDGASGRRIAAYLHHRPFGVPKNRLAQSVLPLPATVAEYTRGRSRRALRTNLSRARAAGLSCAPVDEPRAREALLDELGFTTEVHEDDGWWVARDSAGVAAGALAVTLDREWAMLRALVTRVPDAGWLLHAQLVDWLCTQGARYLFCQPLGALLLPEGLQYFQRVLGFQVMHLSPVEGPQADREPGAAAPARRARAGAQMARLLGRAAADRAIDRALAVQTCGQQRLGEFEAPNRGWYVPSPWWQLLRSLRDLRVSRDDVLVDYGAGKGRVIVAASLFPFGRVIGLEISPELARAAEANVARRRGRRRSGPIEVAVTDAAAWEVPPDATVFYMYSPFTGPVFIECIGRILASLDRAPRRARLVYCNPFEHNYLLGTGRFVPVSAVAVPDSRGIAVTQDVVTYEIVSAASSPAVSRQGAGAWASQRDTSGLLDGFETASSLASASDAGA